MLKIGDILWTFRENDYSVGEILKLATVYIGDKQPYYFISTNGIIGDDQKIFVSAAEDFNTLIKVRYYSETICHTISESVAVNYMREHYSD
jgi:hypothetical protein